MKKLTIQEIKKSEVDILRSFRDFCEANNLKYYLGFGTLLGAVRHKGFIPWDDDIDIFMPRPDYNFLLRHFNEVDHHNRKVISKQKEPDFYLNTAKIIDQNTIMQEFGRTLKIGVWIDIFPLDYLPDNSLKRILITFLMQLLNYLIVRYEITRKESRSWTKNLLVRVWHLIRPPKSWLEFRRDKIISGLERNTSGNYCGLLYRYFGYYCCSPTIPFKLLEPAVKLEFEGDMYNAPAEYDEILKAIYGDYMTLPPVEQQKSRHEYVCYWKENYQEEQP